MNKTNTQQQQPYFQYRVLWIDSDGLCRGYRRFKNEDTAVKAGEASFKRIPLINARLSRRNRWTEIHVEKWVGPHVYHYRSTHVVTKAGTHCIEGGAK